MLSLINMTYPKKYISWGLLALRIAVSIVFIYHGWMKLAVSPGITGFSGLLTTVGIPLPLFFAWVVALTEFLGGIAILLGIFVKPVSILQAIVMIVALITVKRFAFPSSEIDISLLGSLIALYCLGPGRFSLEGYLFKKAEEHCTENTCCQTKQ